MSGNRAGGLCCSSRTQSRCVPGCLNYLFERLALRCNRRSVGVPVWLSGVVCRG